MEKIADLFPALSFHQVSPRSAPDKARPWPWSTLAPQFGERVSGIQPSLRLSNRRSSATQRSGFYACPARPTLLTLHRDRVIPAIAFLLLTQLHPGLLSARRRHV